MPTRKFWSYQNDIPDVDRSLQNDIFFLYDSGGFAIVGKGAVRSAAYHVGDLLSADGLIDILNFN
ncbi:hypothetical protein MASR2M17_21260 [Aminivibrio sp.]